MADGCIGETHTQADRHKERGERWKGERGRERVVKREGASWW